MKSYSLAMEKKSREELYQEIEELQACLEEEQEYSRAIRSGEVDALVVSGADGEQVYTLKEADRPYRIIIEEMKEGTLTLSEEGIILYGNKQFASMLALPLPRLMGTSLYNYVEQSFHPGLEALLSGRDEETRRAEMIFSTPQGGRIFANVSFSPLEIEHAPVILCVVTDVTVERNALEELQKTNALLERMFDSTHILLAYMDREFNFIRVNNAFAAACGLVPEFFMGRNFFDLYPGDEDRPILMQVAQRGEVYSAMEKPFKCFRSGKETIYSDWNLQPVKGGDGMVQGIILTMIDRTDRRRLEKERLLLEQAVEQAGDGIVITDHQGAIQYLNSASVPISGCSRDEMLGRRLGLFGEGVLEDVRRALESEGLWKGHIRNMKKECTGSEVDFTVSAIKDERGGILNYVVIEHDVTNEVKLEQRVHQMQKMEALGRLAGGIAHDLNNILYPIIINAEMLLDEDEPADDLQQSLQHILAAAYRQRDLVKQILAFSRRNDQSLVPVSVIPLIREAITFIRATLPSTIEITQHIHAESDLVLGDGTQIHQVIMNLFSNAADAIGSRTGTIEVSLDEVHLDTQRPDLNPGSYLRLVVSDNGQGIPREVVDHIFEPFYTTKEVGKGSGMGLSVVHGILENHGGKIAIESEPGKGSRFIIYLPLLKKRCQQPDVSAGTLSPARGRKLLLVDDEVPVLTSVSRALCRLGYTVSTVQDTIEALQLFRDAPDGFDLIITDQTMPNMTGAQLAEEVMRERPDMPVILCTGFSEAITDQEARNRGIREILMKPATMKDLNEAIHRAFERS